MSAFESEEWERAYSLAKVDSDWQEVHWLQKVRMAVMLRTGVDFLGPLAHMILRTFRG
jgi:hypothetical protein